MGVILILLIACFILLYQVGGIGAVLGSLIGSALGIVLASLILKGLQ